MEELRVASAFLIVFGLLAVLYIFAGPSRKSPGGWRARLGQFRLLIKPANSANGVEDLRVLRRISLTPTHQIHLVLNDKQKLLLCTFPQGCALLSSGLPQSMDLVDNSATGDPSDEA